MATTDKVINATLKLGIDQAGQTVQSLEQIDRQVEGLVGYIRELEKAGGVVGKALLGEIKDVSDTDRILTLVKGNILEAQAKVNELVVQVQNLQGAGKNQTLEYAKALEALVAAQVELNKVTGEYETLQGRENAPASRAAVPQGGIRPPQPVGGIAQDFDLQLQRLFETLLQNITATTLQNNATLAQAIPIVQDLGSVGLNPALPSSVGTSFPQGTAAKLAGAEFIVGGENATLASFIQDVTKGTEEAIGKIKGVVAAYQEISNVLRTFDEVAQTLTKYREERKRLQDLDAQQEEAQKASEQARQARQQAQERLQGQESSALESQEKAVKLAEANEASATKSIQTTTRKIAANEAEQLATTETTGAIQASTVAREREATVTASASASGASSLTSLAGAAGTMAVQLAASIAPMIAIGVAMDQLNKQVANAQKPIDDFIGGFDKVDVTQIDAAKQLQNSGTEQLEALRATEQAKIDALVEQQNAAKYVIEGWKDSVASPFRATLDLMGFDVDSLEQKVTELDGQIEAVTGNINLLNESWVQNLAVTNDLIAANRENYQAELDRYRLLGTATTDTLAKQQLDLTNQQTFLEEQAFQNQQVLNDAITTTLSGAKFDSQSFLQAFQENFNIADYDGALVTVYDYLKGIQEGTVTLNDQSQDLTSRLLEYQYRYQAQIGDLSVSTEAFLAILQGVDLNNPEAVATALKTINETYSRNYSTLSEATADFNNDIAFWVDTNAFNQDQKAAFDALRERLQAIGEVGDVALGINALNRSQSIPAANTEGERINAELEKNAEQQALIQDQFLQQVAGIRERTTAFNNELNTLATATTQQVEGQVTKINRDLEVKLFEIEQQGKLLEQFRPSSTEYELTRATIRALESDVLDLNDQLQFWNEEVRQSAKVREDEAYAIRRAEELEKKRTATLEQLNQQIEVSGKNFEKAQADLDALLSSLAKQDFRQGVRDDFNAQIATAQEIERQQAFDKQVQDAIEAGNKTQLDAQTNFQKTLTKGEVDFQKSQAQRQEAYFEATEKAEKDFAFRRQRALEDLNDQLLDAVENNDVRAFINAEKTAQKRFEREDEDFAKQQEEAEKRYEKERTLAENQYAERVAQSIQQHQEQMQLREVQNVERINQLIEQNNRELKESEKLRNALAEIEAAWREEDAAIERENRIRGTEERVQLAQQEQEELLAIQAFFAGEQVKLTDEMWQRILKMGYSTAEALIAVSNQFAEPAYANPNANVALPYGGVVPFAEGGVIRKPTLALMGETPQNDEWLIPFPKGQNLFEALGNQFGSRTAPNISVDASGWSISGENTREQVLEYVIEAVNMAVREVM